MLQEIFYDKGETKMEKIPGYDTASPVYGTRKRLPLANYVCTIVDAEEFTSRSGNRCLKLAIDVAEGEYAAFYAEQYNEAKRVDADNAMWPFAGIYYVNMSNVNRFKGFTYCIEKSNKGFQWNWNEKALKGMKFAGLFAEETNTNNEGKTYTDVRLSHVYPLDEFSTMPAAYVKKQKPATPFEGGGYFGASEYAQPYQRRQVDEEIPF